MSGVLLNQSSLLLLKFSIASLMRASLKRGEGDSKDSTPCTISGRWKKSVQHVRRIQLSGIELRDAKGYCRAVRVMESTLIEDDKIISKKRYIGISRRLRIIDINKFNLILSIVCSIAKSISSIHMSYHLRPRSVDRLVLRSKKGAMDTAITIGVQLWIISHSNGLSGSPRGLGGGEQLVA